MTSRNELVLLLPCHSMDDFPTENVGDEADCLLTYWTAPWHPSLILATGHAPKWTSIDDLDVAALESPTTLLCPPIFTEQVPAHLREPPSEASWRIVSESCGRERLVGVLREFLHRRCPEAALAETVPPRLVAGLTGSPGAPEVAFLCGGSAGAGNLRPPLNGFFTIHALLRAVPGRVRGEELDLV